MGKGGCINQPKCIMKAPHSKEGSRPMVGVGAVGVGVVGVGGCINQPRCIMKAPHSKELAWKSEFVTWRYLVLTVCERRRLNKAIREPDAIHTRGGVFKGIGGGVLSFR